MLLANDMLEARDWMYGNLLELLPFRSTLLQELEWHFHVATFALVLGYGYVYNRQVRVDLVREKLNAYKQAWIELIGVSFLHDSVLPDRRLFLVLNTRPMLSKPTSSPPRWSG